MKEKRIKYLHVGIKPCFIDLTPYDKVVDQSQEYPDHSETDIAFFKDGKVVRRIHDVPCDITYEEE